MRTDFTPDNIDLWICNWKRKDSIDTFTRQWLDSYEFETVNVITNHSSVTLDDFTSDIQPKVKIWNNAMRHDDAIGPIVENFNQAYVHTFLSGKKYCICAHDNMMIKKGWDSVIRDTEYVYYSAPQGDQVHIMTPEGLQTFGWWDQRYATNGNHELDYIVRILRKDLGVNKASIVDYHGWHGWPTDSTFEGTDIKSPIVTEGHPQFGRGFPYLRWNDVGLDSYWTRANPQMIPQFSPGNSPWNDVKWSGQSPNTFANFVNGPTHDEIDWYPSSNLYAKLY
jgi:hypothetical protein